MSRENVDVVRRLCAAIGDNDPEVPWLDLCDEAIDIRNVEQFPVADHYQGHDGVRQWVIDAWDVFSEIRHDIEEVIEAPDGETIVTVLRTRGLMRHTGLELDGTWYGVWRVRNGKALQAHGYVARGDALAAAGLSR